LHWHKEQADGAKLTFRLVVVAAQRASREKCLQFHLEWIISVEAAMSVESNLIVDDVMRKWPATIRVFLDHKMRCVGCPIACFHTIDDACREHSVDRAAFLTKIRAVVAQEDAASELEL
jgi:hybrid cluster-associated redox disulfide protein